MQAPNLNPEKPTNRKRVWCSVAYFVVALIFGAWIALAWENVFYVDMNCSVWHLPRLLWCSFATLLGFASLALKFCRAPKSPFPEYILYYPFQLAVIAGGVFGLLHCFEATSGFVFYYLSFSLCVLLATRIDALHRMTATVAGGGL